MTAACGPPAPRPPPPDLSRGLCSPGHVAPKPSAFDAGASDAAHAAAIAACGRCPVLTECRAWVTGLPRSLRPSGVVAGTLYHPHSRAPDHGTDSAYANDGCRCDACRQAHADYQRDYKARRRDAILTAGLATATATAGGVTSLLYDKRDGDGGFGGRRDRAGQQRCGS